jgi:hypothetical protein
MTARTTAMYERIIERVKSVAVQENRAPLEPNLMISDYEVAILTAMGSQFPNARVRGCYFHQGQVRITF